MPITGVNHITLVVSDLSRSRQFYCDLLGAVPRAEGPRALYLELGTLWLCLELGEPQTGGDDSHIAFGCPPEEFASLAVRIIRKAPLWKDNTSEGASVYFSDPDGHRLELHDGSLETRLAHYRAHPEKGMTVL